jgi:acetylornithine/succinyldiaminopimelate/putrescine aminotransferase
MWGLALDDKLPVAKVVEAGYAQKVVMLSSGRNTLRLLPPLTLEAQHLEIFEKRLEVALALA